MFSKSDFPDEMTMNPAVENGTGCFKAAMECNRECGDQNEELKFPLQQDTTDSGTEMRWEVLSEIAMYPITTETHIDITAVLLPSGGTQSHHHAIRTAVSETLSPQDYGVPQQMKDMNTHQYKLFSLPKNQSDGKDLAKSTLPFCFGTQSPSSFPEDNPFDHFFEETQQRKIIILSRETATEKWHLEPTKSIGEKDQMLTAGYCEFPVVDPLYSDSHQVNLIWEMEKPETTDDLMSEFEMKEKVEMIVPEKNVLIYMESHQIESQTSTTSPVFCQDPKHVNSAQLDIKPKVHCIESVSQIPCNQNDMQEDCKIAQQQGNSQDPIITCGLLVKISNQETSKTPMPSGQRVNQECMMGEEYFGVSPVRLDIKLSEHQQNVAFIDISNSLDGKSLPLQLLKEEPFERSTQIHTLDQTIHGNILEMDPNLFNKSELVNEFQVAAKISEEEPVPVFWVKNTEQQNTVSFNSVNVDTVKSDEDEIHLTEQQTPKQCSTCGMDLQDMWQTLEKEDPPPKKGTAKDDLQLESTECREDSITCSEDTDTRKRRSLKSADLLRIGIGLSSQIITNSLEPQSVFRAVEKNEMDSMTPQLFIKTSIQDAYGNLIKESGLSFLEELRTIYLDAEGHGFTLLDSGIVLRERENDIDGNIALITLRNGKKLGMAIPSSNLFLYYHLGIHFYITEQLNEDWYYTKDRVTQETMLMKKVPVISSWMKSLQNFLFLPRHPRLLVPYAVIYDRNGSIHFLMEDRHVLAVGRPPKGYNFNKQKLLWEVLNFLKYCKQNSLFPRDIEDSILYTEQGICFDPSSLDNIEDPCVLKKSVKHTLELLLCNEQQEQLALDFESLLERAYQCLEEEAEWPDRLSLTSCFSGSPAGPIPFSFPCFPNETEDDQRL
ncbi:uncharacterized protein LOC142501881 isoform X2 [Ascaphus truei]|uniref:uncharacterized protein LOC142501881 isoform X2 n=1 Tax=Ascaphus truei TaxID=8439 RepID=UPI003F5A66E7